MYIPTFNSLPLSRQTMHLLREIMSKKRADIFIRREQIDAEIAGVLVQNADPVGEQVVILVSSPTSSLLLLILVMVDI